MSFLFHAKRWDPYLQNYGLKYSDLLIPCKLVSVFESQLISSGQTTIVLQHITASSTSTCITTASDNAPSSLAMKDYIGGSKSNF